MKTAIILVVLFFSIWAQAACVIETSDKSAIYGNGDPLARLFAQLAVCPSRVQDLKAELLNQGAQVAPAMVGNRGFNNPEQGSFSFFETVTGSVAGRTIAKGEFFFGHFTAATDDHQLVLDQTPDAGKLLVELLAWDPSKGLFNFYELIGQGGSTQWYYRGDSADILHDNRFLYRDAPLGQQKFGKTLRCSACHSSGGPIMKELAPPHNDWWTLARPLPFGSNAPTREMQAWIGQLVDADEFSYSVKQGIQRLEDSPAYKSVRSGLSLQERLRPLFCENEINLESSLQSFDSQVPVQIPSGFFLNPRLGMPQVTLSFSEYSAMLQQHSLHFPETRRLDADHPWLTPVKSYSDLLAIQSLMDQGVVDERFVNRVLSIDAANPIFSTARCSILKLVPEGDPLWKTRILERLPAINMPSSFTASLQKLIEVRQSVLASEISQNPRGQILEPGFRVIFPEPSN